MSVTATHACPQEGRAGHLDSGSQVVSGTACPGSWRLRKPVIVNLSSCCTALNHSALPSCNRHKYLNILSHPLQSQFPIHIVVKEATSAQSLKQGALGWSCLLACTCFSSRARTPHLIHSIALKHIPELQGAETLLRQPCTREGTMCQQHHNPQCRNSS